MKKHITNKQLKKLLKYISPVELKFQEDHWGKVPETYWERVDMWYNFLIRYFPYYKIDHFVLAIILLEMQSYYNLYSRIYDKKFKTDPVSNNGATGFMESLELFNTNFLNIESLNIKVRDLHPLSSKDVPKTIDDLTFKDAIIKNYKIEGKEVIIELFKLINNHRDVFQKISDREKKYEKKAAQVLINNKPDIYSRKLFSPILYKYLRVHLPNYSQYSDNKLYTTGGFLLFVLGIMPDTHSDLSDRRKNRDYLRKNFEKALPSDIQ